MIVVTFFKRGDGKKSPKNLITIEKKEKPRDEEKVYFEKLDERLKKLEEVIEKLSSRPPEYQINIDKLEMHNPELKELTFRLDKLDIKELSGALNMGNNFGVKVNKENPPKKDKYPDDKKPSASNVPSDELRAARKPPVNKSPA